MRFSFFLKAKYNFAINIESVKSLISGCRNDLINLVSE